MAKDTVQGEHWKINIKLSSKDTNLEDMKVSFPKDISTTP